MAGTMDIAVVYNDDDSYPSQPAPMSTPMLTNPSAAAAGGAPSAPSNVADVSVQKLSDNVGESAPPPAADE